ncbi:hypothetical protein CPC08DRAFT_66700 [Agrocybe pediades]|nr:hypothetical protein CPC08DRAFT_66700 [Agrocybe pediades]
MSRWVLVDDTDPGITYAGPWFADKGSLDSFGDYGQPFRSTLHGINSSGAFSYTFRGAQLWITSSIQYPTIGNVTNPSWQCILDGEVLESILYTNAENLLGICHKEGLDDSPHTITVRVDVSDNHTFWLDYVQYLPFPGAPLDTAALYIDTTDSEILLGLLGNWTKVYPGYITQQSDSSFSFEFYGVSVLWRGFYYNDLPMDATTATYSIDGQAPVPFELNGASAKSTQMKWSQVLFQTPVLEAGHHVLKVSYQGDENKTPLSLETLIVQNGTNPGSTSIAQGQSSTPTVTSTFAGPTPTSSSSSIASPQKTTNSTPLIVGGVLGGIGILLIVGGIAFFFLRRHRHKRRRPERASTPSHDPRSMQEVIHPFPLYDTTGSLSTKLSLIPPAANLAGPSRYQRPMQETIEPFPLFESTASPLAPSSSTPSGALRSKILYL